MKIAGAGWVTPLGADVEQVWGRLLSGETAPIEPLVNEQNGARYLVRRIPRDALTNLPPHPRLRRASAISRFAAAAGLNALHGTEVDPARTALIFAISNGGVIYTRRFYAEIVSSGAQSASPLLFPETVFNAPASHLAAILGITGASYTVVGDGAVGILALKLAEDLLAARQVEACLVVGVEELDPLVCEAYRRWRLLRDPTRPQSQRGMILSEGAGAVLLRNDSGDMAIETVDPGENFFSRDEIAGKLRRAVARLPSEYEVGIGSANGTFIDQAERAALGTKLTLYSPKLALGDSIGASVLWQVIVAQQALRSEKVPGAEVANARRALVLACGVNQQLGLCTIRSL
ncbi:MAG: hypothetical protein JO354_02040 [Verrucomicrobia bacterium]|nr:hypothetical protein [Verrucomicrobiota bacterium]